MIHAGRSNRAGKAVRSSRYSLIAVVVLGGAAVAFLGFRSSSSDGNAASSTTKPILGDDVPLTAPPPLPADDRLKVRAGLKQVRSLQSAARSRGNDPAAHLQIAQAATPVGDLLTARDEINAALESSSQPAPAAIVDVLARCEAQLGLFSKALGTYRGLVARGPDDATGYVGLSRIQYLLGQKQEAVATLENGAKAVPRSDRRGRLALASEFEARAEVQRALAEAQAVSNTTPAEPMATVMVARLLSKLGRLAEARAVLEKLLVSQPNDADALSAYADLRLNPLLPQNDSAGIEHALLLAGQYNPRSSATYTRLGSFYLEQHRYRQAAYVYTRLLALIPDSAAGRLQLAYSYERLGDRQAGAEQERIAQRLLVRDKDETLLIGKRDAHPTEGQARIALAHHYIEAGQFARALIDLQAAYCLSPSSMSIRHELAAFYKRFGVTPSALPDEASK